LKVGFRGNLKRFLTYLVSRHSESILGCLKYAHNRPSYFAGIIKGTIDSFDYFELRRQSDGLVYQFDRRLHDNGCYGYRRRDADLWILRLADHGWVAVDPITGEISGRPWSVSSKDQKEHRPEGDWVSKKGAKSYVYSLVYNDAHP
jgi:hypothetical protein